MLRAKFKCVSVDKAGDSENVKLSAVTSDTAENATWSNATPSGELTMSITNPSAQGKLEAGKEYFIELTPAATAAADAAPAPQKPPAA